MIRESAQKPDAEALGNWWETIEGWRKRDCMKYGMGTGDIIKPQYVVETLWNMTKDADTYITSDVGQHQMWAAQFVKYSRANSWLNSGGLGTMGYAVPAAMGADGKIVPGHYEDDDGPPRVPPPQTPPPEPPPKPVTP